MQLFPPDCWGEAASVDTAKIGLVVTAWDCASKTGAANDYSANVAVAGTTDGRLLVLDAWKGKADFADLPAIILARYQALAAAYRTTPLLAIEDASAGTQVLQVFEAQAPQVPRIAVKPAGGASSSARRASRRTREAGWWTSRAARRGGRRSCRRWRTSRWAGTTTSSTRSSGR